MESEVDLYAVDASVASLPLVFSYWEAGGYILLEDSFHVHILHM